MGKGKTAAWLLLAALVIALCAGLPGLISSFQDDAAIGRIHYETIPNIQLQIRSNDGYDPFRKLAMMSRMDGGIEISENMASMSREEAQDRALTILRSYIDAGLIQEFEPVVLENRCMLATVSIDPSLNGIYWMVTLVGADSRDYPQLDLAIDDESGAVLAVSFASERAQSARQREETLPAFTDMYFTGLEIGDYSYFVETNMDDTYIGENTCTARYCYVDDVYGDTAVDFYVHEYGFYTEFPDLGAIQWGGKK